MGAKRYKPEEIISKLREAEVLLAEGVSVGEVVRRLGVTQVT
ncbi:MAG: IS3 family transposase, partial [Pseudomonadota bacterium]